MINKYAKFYLTIVLAFIALGAFAQSVTNSSSPYSRYGIGDLNSGLLPQNIAIGGISAATNSIGGFYGSVNVLNPAANGSIGYINKTIIDIGLENNTLFLSQTGQPNQRNTNFQLSHIAFGIPLSKTSAVTFGLQPYSALGYNYIKNLPRGYGTSSPADTNSTNYIYQGEGGLNKAYISYGRTLFKHLSLGVNASYIFGDLKQTQAVEIPGLFGTLNSKSEQDNAIKGFDLNVGAQYVFNWELDKHLTLGYAAQLSSNLSSTSTYIISQYTLDGSGNANVAADSLVNQQGVKTTLHLPNISHFGVAYQQDGKFLVGVDYTIGKWSNLTIGGVNQGLLDSKTLNIGGQYTPNINAINSYWSAVDYRLGFIYDQTYLNVPNPSGGGYTNITSKTVTFGLGLPLKSTFQQAFYKINVAFELGERGTLQNGLVRENFVNLHLGFMINDTWFTRFRFQ
jgi:hypothetical protein